MQEWTARVWGAEVPGARMAPRAFLGAFFVHQTSP